MISYLKGKIIYQALNWLILDVNGVGYKIYLKTENSKLKINDVVEFFTYNHIREDRQELYGFLTIDALQMFETLIGVNGVGPKMAMNILNQIEVEKLKSSIASGDMTIFTAISGVGKKIAAKIIVELRNKITDLGDEELIGILDGGNDVVDALVSLGYKKNEIVKIIKDMPVELNDTQDKVKWVLKKIK